MIMAVTREYEVRADMQRAVMRMEKDKQTQEIELA